ncbi:putative methyltransferase DDB_G0268948 [Hyalella azteca]|uniref:Methyltransferase DDB_G0268948 n=1 Tax=Hyalella azteca TaxID=294128 RepID=A0A8B7P4N0_HYAAZ|nr:putative methyltransferase DDB_G0268948 [Hyalella azteca]
MLCYLGSRCRQVVGTSLAASYLRQRPSPPPSLILNLVNYVKHKTHGGLDQAVDVGCGSGQITRALAPNFRTVLGLDVSQAQLDIAQSVPNPANVSYCLLKGEDPYPVEDESVALVTSCMAAHWFDMPKFFTQVDRVLVKGGVLALIGYHIPQPQWPGKTQVLKDIMYDFYWNKIGQHFGRTARDEIDLEYRTPKYAWPSAHEILRESAHHTDVVMSLASLGDYVTTMSGYTGYRHHYGDEAAQTIKNDLLRRLLTALEVPSSAEDTMLPMRFHYFASYASKQP